MQSTEGTLHSPPASEEAPGERGMLSGMMNAEGTTERQRARFQVVRQRVFASMKDATSRRRTALMVPFLLLVLPIFVAHGESVVRLIIQAAAFGVCLAGLSISERTHGTKSFIAFLASGASVLVGVANTGGLASPLLLSTVPFLIACAMNPNLDRKRYGLLAFFLAGFIAMALASSPAFAELVPNLHWTDGEFIAISLLSATMAAVAVFNMGRSISIAYERIALELAVRREELCDESEGRTRALEGIAARLAHEVKNPLAAIKGLSTHVARSAVDEKVKERLTIVAAEAERLQEIVEGFLSFSRGLDDLSVGPAKPYDIARELSLLLETRAADAEVALEVRGSRELTLNADGKKLRQALLNLVLNAMHASSKGTTVALEIAKNCADGAAVIRVVDRGAGMSPEILERIQRPYYTTKEGGSGLGIAVARGIIEQHGGTLRFESVEGRGTTATVTLPACAMEAQAKKMNLPTCRGAMAIAAVIEPFTAASRKVEEPS